MSEVSPTPPQDMPTVRLPQQTPARRTGRSGWAVGLIGVLALVLFGIAGASLLLMRPGHATTSAQVATATPNLAMQTTPTNGPTVGPTYTPHPTPTTTPTTVPQRTQPTPTHVPTPAPTATPRGTPTPVPTPSCTAPVTEYSTTPIHGDDVTGGSGFSTLIGALTIEIVVQQKPDGHGGCTPTDVRDYSIITLTNSPEASGTACATPPHTCYVQGTVIQIDTNSGNSTSWMSQHTIDSGPFSGSLLGGDDTNPAHGSGQQCANAQGFYLDNFGMEHLGFPPPQYCWTP